ncbi:PucR family transcriptional regulator ligand-binding domain-containing protein [Paenarthrobacter sp. NPDC089316]|uniref:PucR family transcriptional regulator n=1 Tax=unclassified Paenarthrobacter TaxID=2634190 RepID=UPI0034127D6F
MAVPLSEVLASEALLPGQPVILAGRQVIARRMVRWVHSSEVVQIAPLLRGGELLLVGGQNFLALREGAQLEYIRSLSERGVACVAFETAGGRSIPSDVLAAAEDAGLPLVELRNVVPFVEVAEWVNRRIVSRQVEALQIADALSQQLAERMAAGGSPLLPILELTANALDASVAVIDPRGVVMESAGVEPDRAHPPSLSVDLNVGGIDIARLEICSTSEDRDLLETVAQRIRGIVALALSQRHRPSLARMADDALMRMIVAGGGGDQLHELSEAAGLPPDVPVAVAIFRSRDSGRPAPEAERALRAKGGHVRLHAHGDLLIALVAFDRGSNVVARQELIGTLRESLAGNRALGAIGPTEPSIRGASRSLIEARTTLRLGRASKWEHAVYDSADFVVERFAERELPRHAVDAFVEETLGPLMELEQRRGGELVRTLDVWITEGCNTAEAARVLFLERQSLHKRLARIFEVLGGDPRGTGRLGALAFAVKLVRGNARLSDGARA